MSTWIDDYLTSPSVPREKDEDGNVYGISVLGNGCNLFFQKNDRYLICEIDMLAFGLVSSTIRQWNTGQSIGTKERATLLPIIVGMFEKHCGQGRKADVR